MKPIAIIHFQPLEFYPPAQNLVTVLSKRTGRKIFVYTSKTKTANITAFEAPASNVTIERLSETGFYLGAFTRYFNYAVFYTRCFFKLIGARPQHILYFETLSSFPVFLYKKLVNKKVKVLIHYHEYTSPAEYASGMLLNKYFHRSERSLYKDAVWVSHTNEHRMQQFIQDICPAQITAKYVLPNFPPASWRKSARSSIELPVKFVYAGALSLDTMYTKEFADWIIEQKGKATWHIYSQNITTDAKIYLQNLAPDIIKLMGEVTYSDLPDVLSRFDVGVILYNGHIPNYVFNAPNKLFEYYACGLDVWFPDVMVDCRQYATHLTYPKIVPVDFTRISSLDIFQAINRTGYSIQMNSYSCEEALVNLTAKLQND